MGTGVASALAWGRNKWRLSAHIDSMGGRKAPWDFHSRTFTLEIWTVREAMKQEQLLDKNLVPPPGHTCRPQTTTLPGSINE